MPDLRYELHHRICNLRYGTHGCGRTAASYSSFSRSCLYMVSASVLIFHYYRQEHKKDRYGGD